MTKEDYIKLGEEHVRKDKEITLDEVKEKEKILNSHSLAWLKMWNTGEAHQHKDRIRSSKVSHSGNRADLYLSYKDHKSVPGKTRPIATGCSSNTLALSNSVSTLVEAVASASEEKMEVISSEDMLFHSKLHDKRVQELRRERRRGLLRKLKCDYCDKTRLIAGSEEVTCRTSKDDPIETPTDHPYRQERADPTDNS